MGALSISAVDHTTGQLTVTGHGQVTGAGPAALFAGSGGAIPTGLAPVTDYWLYVVDANTLKLADSSAHALAGTTLSFTDNGTLPLSLLVGLPYRRAATFAAKAQIPSSVLNAMEDSLVAFFNALTGQSEAVLGGVVTLATALKLASAADLKHAADWPIPFGFDYVLESGTATYSGDAFGPTAAVTAIQGIRGLRGGDVITSVDFGIAESTASWTYALCRKPTAAAGATTTIATGTINSGTSSITTRTLAGINHTVDATYAYFLKLTTTAGAGITTGGTVHVTH